ncbi:MAG TPA: iron-sulfur cluster-binding domain-containing protein [Archangium sp.]|nr:iron-sulfur cluster-binding domain-containing protein [Archangium sp.]
MNELMMPVGVFLASATWEWYRRRPTGRRGELEQAWHAVDTVRGPPPMLDAARTVLRSRGVPAGSISEERALGSHEVTFRTSAGVSTVQVAGQTLLQAAREAKLPLDSLCERGVCGTCKVRVCSGAMESGEALALSEQERADGYVLACVARPASAATVEL